MPCFHPLRVALDEDERLDWSVYTAVGATQDLVLVPCRKCLGCLQGVQREWAIRCHHEAQAHWTKWTNPETRVSASVPNSCMVTLTYADPHLPDRGRLVPDHVSRFLQRLRNRRRGTDKKLRYFYAGEYGGKTYRPHYHLLIMGDTFEDRYTLDLGGKAQQSSYELDELWQMGAATIDDFNYQTACYVAGYVAKKLSAFGQMNGPHDEITDPETGETRIVPVEAEFRRMSRGLGKWYLEAHLEEIYERDSIDIGEFDFPPPTQYDRWFRDLAVSPEDGRPLKHYDLWMDVRRRRLDKRLESQVEWTPERLAAAEQIAMSALNGRQDNL